MVAVMKPESTSQPFHNVRHIIERVQDLENLHAPLMAQRTLTRDLLSGGEGAVVAILGKTAVQKAKAQGKDPYRLLPISNLLLKAMDRQAQRLGIPPTLKVLPTKDTATARDHAEKREMVIEWLDHESRLELQLPTMSRWVPGYGFGVWLLKQRTTPEGIRFAHVAQRDPYDCYPSEWGPDQEPDELAIKRRIPTSKFRRMFPQLFQTSGAAAAFSDSGRALHTGAETSGGWEGTQFVTDSQTVWEFYDVTGTYLLHWDSQRVLGFWPNPISRPPFVIERRASFGKLSGQWDDHIGMMSSLARMHALATIFAQDNVLTETNVIGEVLSGQYKKGRGAINKLAPGSTVEKPVNQANFQVFTQIDRIERLLRNAASYPVAADGESPLSFLTGQGLDNLMGGISAEIREYQTLRRWSLKDLDSKRLEWDEKVYGGQTRTLTGDRKDASFSVSYDPSAVIDGNWRTQRKFGAMAGFDEPQKIVAGLQLLGAGVLDPETLAEELDGIDSYKTIRERNIGFTSMDRLYDVLSQQAQAGDPRATMALVELAKSPSKATEVLEKFFTPEGDALSPEEAAIAQGGLPTEGAGGGGGGDLQTMLARLTQGGQAQGGVQTVTSREI